LWCDFKTKALTVNTDRQSTPSQINRIFAKDVLPYLGKRSIFEVAGADLLEILRKIEERLVDIVASIQANHSRAGRSKKSASFIPLSPINHTLAVG
jgi:mRNA-degrading endonuclease HigB of HigAB toxin-antitoxin module